MGTSLEGSTMSGTSWPFFLAVGFCFLAWCCQTGGTNSTELQQIQERLRNPQYNAAIRPPGDNGEAVTVEVDILINSVGPVNDSDMTWTASFYLRQEWRDRRLQLGEHADRDLVKLNEDLLDHIWQPDIFFSNSKEGLRHQLTVPNRLLYINVTTGRVLTSQRLTMVLNCDMDLVKFPLDEQTCQIVMESYSYSVDDMVLRWSSKRNATDLEPTVYIPDFEIVSMNTVDCTKTYALGTYPCLEVSVRMRREIWYYVFQTYLPTLLIVILSWASFWIDHEAAPARVSVGLLTVLTITTQLAGSTALLPRVPYIKAIDVWMSVNLVLVFSAYMEYPVVTALSRRYKKAAIRRSQQEADDEPKKPEDTRSVMAGLTAPEPQQQHQQRQSTARARLPRVNSSGQALSVAELARRPSIFPASLAIRDPGRQVDKKSRFLFPLAFVVFNVVYWVYYTV